MLLPGGQQGGYGQQQQQQPYGGGAGGGYGAPPPQQAAMVHLLPVSKADTALLLLEVSKVGTALLRLVSRWIRRWTAIFLRWTSSAGLWSTTGIQRIYRTPSWC